jgi:hypothetical protein
VFAHSSHEYLLNPARFWQDLGIEATEIQGLISRGLAIVNHYSDLFHAQSFRQQIVGREDYQSVLGALKRDFAEHERRIYEEMKAAGMLDLEGNRKPRAE